MYESKLKCEKEWVKTNQEGSWVETEKGQCRCGMKYELVQILVKVELCVLADLCL